MKHLQNIRKDSSTHDRIVAMLHDLFITGVVGLFILLMVISVFFLLMSLGE
ncbi:hypothetical protein GYRE_00776 [Yokenella regensburgei ATCC 49455]|nr:hypothetical protein GYRE_00776 [Yokenella regensburgei ATCC 49455]